MQYWFLYWTEAEGDGADAWKRGTKIFLKLLGLNVAAEHTTLKYSFGVICKLLNVAGKKHFFYKWSSDGDKEFFISYQLKRAGTLMVFAPARWYNNSSMVSC